MKSTDSQDVENLSMEERILHGAREVFMRKGYAGTTMKEIADEMGINKSLLHYYYRSKDRLFGAIFQEAFRKFMPHIGEILMSDQPFETKIRQFIRNYIGLLRDNPYIPGFVLHELSSDPQKLITLFQGLPLQPQMINDLVIQEMDQGTIRKSDPVHLIINLLALCIFPFVARPILENVILKGMDKDFDGFLDERVEQVSDFVIQAIHKS
jgi:AcrR family transcriptional regulator